MDFQSVLSTRLFSVSGHWAVISRKRKQIRTEVVVVVVVVVVEVEVVLVVC